MHTVILPARHFFLRLSSVCGLKIQGLDARVLGGKADLPLLNADSFTQVKLPSDGPLARCDNGGVHDGMLVVLVDFTFSGACRTYCVSTVSFLIVGKKNKIK